MAPSFCLWANTLLLFRFCLTCSGQRSQVIKTSMEIEQCSREAQDFLNFSSSAKAAPSTHYYVILSVRDISNTSLTAPEDSISLSNSGFRYAVKNYFCRCLCDINYCDFLLSPLLFSLISPLTSFKPSR